MAEDDFLAMSGIQHFAFCRRQWALIHLEQQWAENLRTAEGRLEHDRCHDDTFAEKRGDLLVVRGMRVNSGRLRLYQLGSHYKSCVEHIGLHPEFAQDEVLLL